MFCTSRPLACYFISSFSTLSRYVHSSYLLFLFTKLFKQLQRGRDHYAHENSTLQNASVRSYCLSLSRHFIPPRFRFAFPSLPSASRASHQLSKLKNSNAHLPTAMRKMYTLVLFVVGSFCLNGKWPFLSHAVSEQWELLGVRGMTVTWALLPSPWEVADFRRMHKIDYFSVVLCLFGISTCTTMDMDRQMGYKIT